MRRARGVLESEMGSLVPRVGAAGPYLVATRPRALSDDRDAAALALREQKLNARAAEGDARRLPGRSHGEE